MAAAAAAAVGNQARRWASATNLLAHHALRTPPPAAAHRLGLVTKIVFDKYEERGRAWAAAVRARSWDTLVPAHASLTLRGRRLGRDDFDDCFGFLLEAK